jgi:hypothetical protein
MSSTSPYKSKLFNFLNRQSIGWNSRLVQAARRLKITLEWGAQIAVYPLYLLVQSGRVAARQLGAARSKQQTEAMAIAPTVEADSAIKTLTQTQAEETTQALRGIACDLASRQIFFVDPQNQLVTPDQSQESLQKQIRFHLSNFNYQQRQQQQAAIAPSEPRILPPVQSQNPTLLPPVRWLLQSISWIEHSPVAIAIDLFGESRWHTAIIPPEIYAPSLLPPLPLRPILAPIDATVADLEIKLIQPAVSKSSILQRFVATFFAQHPPAQSSTLDPAMERLPNPWLVQLDVNANPLPDATENNGIKNEWLPTPQPKITPKLTPQVSVTEPMLLPPTKTPSSQSLQVNVHLPGQKLKPNPHGRSPLALAQKPSTSERTIRPLDESDRRELTTIEPEDPSAEIEAKPIWIETQALSVGYEKHFLERILKKVDQIMAWVENTIAHLFSKLKP